MWSDSGIEAAARYLSKTSLGALACERLTELKLTAGRERVWGPTTACVPGSAGV